MMKEARDQDDTDVACLLAIMSGIAACDAFTIFHLRVVCASQRHEDAVEVFTRVSGLKGIQEAARHLAKLLHAKGSIEYSDRIPRPDETRALCSHAERFLEFVELNLKLPG